MKALMPFSRSDIPNTLYILLANGDVVFKINLYLTAFPINNKKKE